LTLQRGKLPSAEHWEVRINVLAHRALGHDALARLALRETDRWWDGAIVGLAPAGDSRSPRANRGWYDLLLACLLRRQAHAGIEGKTVDPFVSFVLARSCAIGPEPDVGPERLVQWAESALAAEKQPSHIHALGLALYRAGRLDESIRRLEEADTSASE